MAAATGKQSFWDHLDVLRAAMVKIVAVTVVFGIVAFCFKETLFSVILAPKNAGFITYRFFGQIVALSGSSVSDFYVQLINTGLAQQFIIHMKTAMYAGGGGVLRPIFSISFSGLFLRHCTPMNNVMQCGLLVADI